MSLIPTQGQEIIVDSPDSVGSSAKHDTHGDLVSWLVEKASRWEDIRDQGVGRYWPEYWRIWRGFWSTDDQNKRSERSRIITPALAQAVEMTVSEIEEACFSRERWIDLADDVTEAESADMGPVCTQLLQDLELVNAKDAFSEAVQNGALFGTSIVKVCTDVYVLKEPVMNENTGRFEPKEMERPVTYWESIRPDEFIPDPAGRTIQEMLGCFHKVRKPLHAVLEKCEKGIYLKTAVGNIFGAPAADSAVIDANDPGVLRGTSAGVDVVEVLEYHGKVPAKFLFTADTPADELLMKDLRSRKSDGDGPLVEAIVTIANDQVLLRAMANPFMMKDRAIVAWAFEKVPGRFWGRGVSEKGINSQRALDAEVRARIDALGFISAPMLGVDINRMAKGFKRDIFPGKVWPTNGNPNEIINPIRIGEINAATFNQAQDMERMVQMGTGAFDTGSALGRGQTSSGGNAVSAGSLFMGAFVKRAKRAFQNVDRNGLKPLIEKTMWRNMDFNPELYPKGIKFVVKGSLGIVAREVEQLNLTQTMAMLPEDSPARNVIAIGIIEQANVHNKKQIMDALLAASQPPTPEQQALQQEHQRIEMETLQAELDKLKAQNVELQTRAQNNAAQANRNNRAAETEDDKVEIERVRTHLNALEIDNFAVQNRIAAKGLEIKEKQVNAQMRKAAQPK